MKNKIKILFYAPKPPPIGGIATWFDIVYKNKPKNFDFDFINSSVNIKRQKAKGIFKIFRRIIDFRKQFSLLKTKINTEKIDILHIATSGGIGFYRDLKFIKYAHKRNVKVVIHLHFGRTASLFIKKNSEFKKMIKVFKLTDKIICIDFETLLSLQSNGFGNKTVFVPNPVEIHQNSYNNKSRKILFIGTLNRNKGFNELYNAFNELESADWNLNFIGPIDDEKEIKLTIENNLNSNINFLGEIERSKVLEEISSASFIVLPSYTEGMPYCILEAISFAIPVIATRVGGIPYILENNQMIISPKSDTELKERLQNFMSSNLLRKKLSDFCYTIAKKKFSIEIIMGELNKIWSELL